MIIHEVTMILFIAEFFLKVRRNLSKNTATKQGAFQQFKTVIFVENSEQNFVNKNHAETLDIPTFSAFNNVTLHFHFTS